MKKAGATIKKKLFRIMIIFLAAMVLIVLSDHILSRFSQEIAGEVKNQYARRDLGKIILKRLYTIELELQNLTFLEDFQHDEASCPALKSVTDIDAILKVLNEGGTFTDTMPVNLSYIEKITEKVTFKAEKQQNLNESVRLFPKIDQIKGLIRQLHRLQSSPQAGSPELKAQKKGLLDSARNMLIRSQEEANMVFYNTNLELDYLENRKKSLDRLFGITSYLVILIIAAIWAILFCRTIRKIGQIVMKWQEAREQSAIFKKFAENAGQGFWMANLEGSIVFANRALVEMLGYPDYRDITGRKIGKFQVPEYRKIFEKQILPAVLETGQQTIELPLLSLKSQTIPAIQNIFLIHSDDHKPIYLANVITNITERIQSEESVRSLNEQLEQRVSERTSELQKIHGKLMEASRLAGMAEVSTDVLHNVGNVLNSINVSVTLINEKMRNSEIVNLKRVMEMMGNNQDNLGSYLTEDKRGKYIPTYLTEVSRYLSKEREFILEKLKSLYKNVEHIKEIITAQQSYSKAIGVESATSIVEQVESAIQIISHSLRQHHINVERHYTRLPKVNIDKQRVILIIVNLINNAKHALISCERKDLKMLVRIYKNENNFLRIEVSDNGIGISKKNLTHIFRHGFTTREKGHGFGLHSGALAAREMGGSLTAYSKGEGHGATFVLELPYKPVKE